MKSFLPPNWLKAGMCLLHLQKATVHTGCGQRSRTSPTPSQVPRTKDSPM